MNSVKCNLVDISSVPKENSCFRGGILAEVKAFAHSTFGTSLPSKLESVPDIPEFLTSIRESNVLTVRQYLFVAGLCSSYQQMRISTSRTVYSDDSAKSMFSHLIDLIKPTCTDVKLDITGPGSASQLKIKRGLTGKLELSYSSYQLSSYDYSLVLVLEMKSERKRISIDTDYPEECQLLAQMAYCIQQSDRSYVLGMLYIGGFITVYVLFHASNAYVYAKVPIDEEVHYDLYANGFHIEQLIYHALHNSLNVQYMNNELTIECTWKHCSIWKELYCEDALYCFS